MGIENENPLLWDLIEIDKMKLNKNNKKILELWFLNCEDMALPEGGCEKCEFKYECELTRIKIFRHSKREDFEFK